MKEKWFFSPSILEKTLKQTEQGNVLVPLSQNQWLCQGHKSLIFQLKLRDDQTLLEI